MMSPSEAQLVSMLELQNGMNSKVNPEWIAANNNWHRAIQVEATEAIEHHGWKWWKKQECDMAQLRMELVDIWHFILSAAIQHRHGHLAQTKMDMMAELNLHQRSVPFDNRYYVLAEIPLLEKLDLLVGLSASRRTSLALFESLLLDCGMSWEELFKQYLGKNVLNIFRQDFGYKSGTYIKVWDGREDNEHLLEVLGIVDLTADDARDALYKSLEQRYSLVVKATLA